MAHALATIGARFDHTAVAGPSMSALVAFYGDTLGGVFSHGEVLPIGAVVLTFVLAGGRIELMAPTPGSTFLDRFLESTGGRGGVHHLTFEVRDIDAAVAVLHEHPAIGARVHEYLRPHTVGVVDEAERVDVSRVQERDGCVDVGDLASIVNRDIDALMGAAQ